MTWPSVELDTILKDADPVSLLDRALGQAGGVLRAISDDRPDTVLFRPSAERLSEFHTAERAGALVNYNTPAVEQLFDGTIFVLSGEAHRRARLGLVRYFGPLGSWHEEVSTAVCAWVGSVSELPIFDLLDQTRELARGIFLRIAFDADPRSAGGRHLAELVDRFLQGARAAAGADPDLPTLRDAIEARNELLDRFSQTDRDGEGTSFASRAHRGTGDPINPHDLSSVLVASIETTANLLGWTIVRWIHTAPPRDADLIAFARSVEQMHSPNTLVTRQAVAPIRFAGERLPPGTLLAYSPAGDAGHAPSSTRSARSPQSPSRIVFGAGRRMCPGRAMARFIVRKTLSTMADAPIRWSLAGHDVPRPVSWFPVQSFGPGVMIRTTA
jgi:cytochrome P450